MGLIEETRPVDEVAQGCVEEILQGIKGPLALYGHCGLGVMLTVEIARRLEAAGRPVEAIYLGGIFPFARPAGGADPALEPDRPPPQRPDLGQLPCRPPASTWRTSNATSSR